MTIKKINRLRTLTEVERIWILRTYYTLGFCRERTHKALGISRRCLYNKLKQYEREGWIIPRYDGNRAKEHARTTGST